MFDLWFGKDHAGREYKFTPHLYRNKGFTKDLKEKKILLLGWRYRPNDLLMDQELDTAYTQLFYFWKTTEHMDSDQAVMIYLKYISVPLS